MRAHAGNTDWEVGGPISVSGRVEVPSGKNTEPCTAPDADAVITVRMCVNG